MNDQLPADSLPALYRTILDDLWALERAGERGTAARLRTAATRAYSRAWDAKALHELESIGARTHRTLARAEAERSRPTARGIRTSLRGLLPGLAHPSAATSRTTSPTLG